MRVLILGGYGVFGSRLARLLARDGRLTLLIAGRSRAKAQALCDQLDGGAQREALVLDHRGDVADVLTRARPHVLVDAAGPFQAYGVDPYRLARACIEAGVNYLDLADAAEFVAGITGLDEPASARGVFALSGLSTVPALSSAVAAALAGDLDSLSSIRLGVAPSPRAGMGLSVIRAAASYAGKPLPVIADGAPTLRPGLIDSLRRTIAVPGELPLHNTLFALAEAPDLMLARTWPKAGALRTLWTGAGARPEALLRMLRGLAWLVRLRLLPSLEPLAGLLHWGSRTLVWGEHRGGMFVEIEGEGAMGPVKRAWHLVAEGDDGPFIPSIGAAIVVQRMSGGLAPKPGARPAAGELGLADYEAVFDTLSIHTGVWDEPPPGAPLYRRMLGDAWDRLAAPIRALHELSGEKVVTGEATVIRGRGPLAWLAGLVMGFPRAGERVPVTVEIHRTARRRTLAAHVRGPVLPELPGGWARALGRTGRRALRPDRHPHGGPRTGRAPGAGDPARDGVRGPAAFVVSAERNGLRARRGRTVQLLRRDLRAACRAHRRLPRLAGLTVRNRT